MSERISGDAAVEVSRFSGAILDVMDKVKCRRVPASAVSDPIFKLRYDAYRREESVPFNDAGTVIDELDETANAASFGIHIGDQLVSSVRVHHLTPDLRKSPSMKVYPDILGPMLDRGETFIDPSRFTADYEASLAYPALPFLTLRIAVMAAMYHDADWVLALVRPAHTAFYRRVFGSTELCDTRDYPGLAFPVQLFGARVSECMATTLARYPFFLSTDEERRALFGPDPSGEVAATSRQAFAEWDFTPQTVAAQ